MNNDMEYEAVIAAEIGICSLCLDSELVVNQILGEFQTHEERLMIYLWKFKSLLKELEHHIVKHIPREENHEANSLAKQASLGEELIQGTVPVRNQDKPRFEEVHAVALIKEEKTWMTPIIAYLSEGVLPIGRNEYRQLLRKAFRYTI